MNLVNWNLVNCSNIAWEIFFFKSHPQIVVGELPCSFLEKQNWIGWGLSKYKAIIKRWNEKLFSKNYVQKAFICQKLAQTWEPAFKFGAFKVYNLKRLRGQFTWHCFCFCFCFLIRNFWWSFLIEHLFWVVIG